VVLLTVGWFSLYKVRLHVYASTINQHRVLSGTASQRQQVSFSGTLRILASMAVAGVHSQIFSVPRRFVLKEKFIYVK
jgi:hypothetical protein